MIDGLVKVNFGADFECSMYHCSHSILFVPERALAFGIDENSSVSRLLIDVNDKMTS